ncbi:MAG: nickel-type superoxide dismutase maturation protease [Phormidesmis sp.]
MPLKRDWKEIGLWALGKRWRFHVTGHSMRPTLCSGEDVLVRPVSTTTPLSANDVVVCFHPFKPNVRMIKRISETFYDGSCYVLSDNAAEGSDSRSFGVVARSLIIGKVTSKLI